MCYTIQMNLTRAEIEIKYGARFEDRVEYKPSYFLNAFTFPLVPVVTQHNPHIVALFHWGLIPYWARNEKSANEIRIKTGNARKESLLEKPSFKHTLKSNRCIIPAVGFFEWHTLGREKYPYYITFNNEENYAFAGISDTWINKETGEEASTFSIITVPANPLMARIHNAQKRMPAILNEQSWKTWIMSEASQAEVLDLLRPFNQDKLTAYTISKLITSRTEDKNRPELLTPYTYQVQLPGYPEINPTLF